MSKSLLLRLCAVIKQQQLRRRFKYFGIGAFLDSPLQVDGPENISIGADVVIQAMAWLAALPLTGAATSELVIEDGAVIGHFCHIYATKRIVIRKSALLADRVYISDNLHDYTNPHVPIMNQPILQKNEVSIGEGCWIGENVSVIGASVGRNSVIGANSVVTKNVPDYCVAVGAPAKIIKQYCFKTQKWERTFPDGE